MAKDYSRAEVLDIIEREAQERGIPRDDFMRFAYIETGGTFDEQVSRGERGAKGLFQFVPGTATQYGIRGREFDAVANTDAAAQLYQDNQRSIVRRHEQDGLPYLSGKAQPDGLDMYLAHQQGVGGYRSIQAAISSGEFSRSDTRSNVLNNVSARDLSAAAGVSMTEFRAMSDRDMAETFVKYWDYKFDHVRIPEKGIEVVAENGRKSVASPQNSSREKDSVSSASETKSGLALTAAHAMAIKYDDIGYKMGEKNIANGSVDCSGWVVALQNATMAEINEKAGRTPPVFSKEDRFSPGFDGSGAIVQKAAQRSGVLLEGGQVTAESLKEGMVIGLDTGPAPHDKWKGIDHVAMVVRDPQSGDLMVTESKGGKNDRGVRMLPVDDFLQTYSRAKLFAADPLSKARDLLQERQQSLGERSTGEALPAYGERGPAVKALQENLKSLGVVANDGTGLSGTGYYGEKTKEVVANFQRQNGIAPTGAADKATLEAIDRKLGMDKVADGTVPAVGAKSPLLSEPAHPNHALYADVSRRLSEQTGTAPKPEVTANITMQLMENGIRQPADIQGLAVRGTDVHVQGPVPGARLSVDLNAPTASLQAISEHTARQSQERAALERQNAQAQASTQVQ